MRLVYDDQHPFVPAIHGMFSLFLCLACTSADTSALFIDTFVTPTTDLSRQRVTTVLLDKREHAPF